MPNIQFSLADLSLAATVIECLLITALVKTIPTPSQSARNILALLFITIAVDALCMLLIWHPDLRTVLTPASGITVSLTTLALLAKGPLLYFFIKAASTPGFRFTRKHSLHAMPVVLGFALVATFSLSTHKVTIPVEANLHNWGTFFWWTLLRTSPVAYAMVTLFALRNLHNVFDNHYSGSEYLYARWVRLIIIGFLVQWSMGLGVHLAGQYLPNGLASILGKISDLAGLILVNILLAACFTIIRALIPIVSPLSNPPKNRESTQAPEEPSLEKSTTPSAIIDNANNNRHLASIKKLIEHDKIYLNPTLNLEKLSILVGAPTKEVSRTINEDYKANFSEFINGYRVSEALRLLELPEHENTSITDIIYLSGFNSKSAFQRFFKRRTDSSPTRYRQQIKQRRAASK